MRARAFLIARVSFSLSLSVARARIKARAFLEHRARTNQMDEAQSVVCVRVFDFSRDRKKKYNEEKWRLEFERVLHLNRIASSRVSDISLA